MGREGSVVNVDLSGEGGQSLMSICQSTEKSVIAAKPDFFVCCRNPS